MVFISCKQMKKTKVTETSPVQEENNPIYVQLFEAPVDAPDSVDLDFRLVQVVPFKDSVQVRMRYGGGCVKPHLFEMYTSATLTRDDIIDIYLAHKTHNDLCKAFVFTERTFLWSHVLRPGQKIRINKGEVIQIPDK